MTNGTKKTITINPCITIVWDNGGGMTIQDESVPYAHHYSDPKEAARDGIMSLLDGEDCGGWDGNDLDGLSPEDIAHYEHNDEQGIIEYDGEAEASGQMRHWNYAELESAIERSTTDMDEGHWWGGMQAATMREVATMRNW